AVEDGLYAQAFPSFGAERTGAPVLAFTRIDKEFIRNRNQVYEPDMAIVLDSTLLFMVKPAAGLKSDGLLVVNTKRSLDEIRQATGFSGKVAAVDATSIALKFLKANITNTTMLGAAARFIEGVKLDSVIEQVRTRFPNLADANTEAVKAGYQEVKVIS
ncbi:MAG: 2-oxoacid:acceptor oxidoreductase family protein, partial [Candidatus Marsarchaeota archaeon]